MRELSFEEILDFIRKMKVNSINVCGSPGSGKSTLTKRIAFELGFEVIDLDSIFYNDDCVRHSKQKDEIELNKIFTKKNYIIDGTYTSSINYRLGKIDLFIFTKKSKLKCLYRFIKRRFINKDIKCGEKITLKTLELILRYKYIEQNLFKCIIPNENLIIYKDR